MHSEVWNVLYTAFKDSPIPLPADPTSLLAEPQTPELTLALNDRLTQVLVLEYVITRLLRLLSNPDPPPNTEAVLKRCLGGLASAALTAYTDHAFTRKEYDALRQRGYRAYRAMHRELLQPTTEEDVIATRMHQRLATLLAPEPGLWIGEVIDTSTYSLTLFYVYVQSGWEITTFEGLVLHEAESARVRKEKLGVTLHVKVQGVGAAVEDARLTTTLYNVSLGSAATRRVMTQEALARLKLKWFKCETVVLDTSSLTTDEYAAYVKVSDSKPHLSQFSKHMQAILDFENRPKHFVRKILVLRDVASDENAPLQVMRRLSAVRPPPSFFERLHPVDWVRPARSYYYSVGANATQSNDMDTFTFWWNDMMRFRSSIVVWFYDSSKTNKASISELLARMPGFVSESAPGAVPLTKLLQQLLLDETQDPVFEFRRVIIEQDSFKRNVLFIPVQYRMTQYYVYKKPENTKDRHEISVFQQSLAGRAEDILMSFMHAFWMSLSFMGQSSPVVLASSIEDGAKFFDAFMTWDNSELQGSAPFGQDLFYYLREKRARVFKTRGVMNLPQ